MELSFKQASAKEHAEYVIWVKFFFLIVLPVPLLEVLFWPMLVVDLALIRIAETSKCLGHLLESISRLRSSVLVWVELKCELLIGLLDLIIWSCLCNSQNLIVVALPNHFFAFFYLSEIRSLGSYIFFGVVGRCCFILAFFFGRGLSLVGVSASTGALSRSSVENCGISSKPSLNFVQEIFCLSRFIDSYALFQEALCLQVLI